MTIDPNKPFSLEEFQAIYSKVPRLCVDLIIRGQYEPGIVLAKRALPSWHGQWHFPGGTVKYEETVHEAVARVLAAEVGTAAMVRPPVFAGYIEYPSERRERGFGWTISLALYCTIPEGAVIRPNDDASAMEKFYEMPVDLIAEQREFLRARYADGELGHISLSAL